MGKRYGLHKYGGERGSYAEYAAFDTVTRERDSADSWHKEDMVARTALLNDISAALAASRLPDASPCLSLRAAKNVVGNIEAIALADLARQAADELRDSVRGECDAAITDLGSVCASRYLTVAADLLARADEQMELLLAASELWQRELLAAVTQHPEEWYTPSDREGPEGAAIRFRVFAGAARPHEGRFATGVPRDFGLAVYVGDDAVERLRDAATVLRGESKVYHPSDYREVLPYRIVTCRRDTETEIAPHKALEAAGTLGRTMGRKREV